MHKNVHFFEKLIDFLCFFPEFLFLLKLQDIPQLIILPELLNKIEFHSILHHFVADFPGNRFCAIIASIIIEANAI